jgi:hypothetical protein
LDVVRTLGFSMASAAVFIIVGAAWLALGLIGEGSIYLISPGIVNVLAGALIFAGIRGRIVASLALASAIYNLVLVVYQAFASVYALTQGFNVFYIAASVVYFLLTIFFVIFGFAVYSKTSALGMPEPEKAKETEEPEEEFAETEQAK